MNVGKISKCPGMKKSHEVFSPISFIFISTSTTKSMKIISKQYRSRKINTRQTINSRREASQYSNVESLILLHVNIWTSVAVTDPTPVHIDSTTNICGHETNISICHLVSASFARVKLGKAFLDSPLGAGSKLEAPRWSSRQGVLRFVNSKKKQWPSDMWDPLICLFVSYHVLLVLCLFLCLFWLRFSKKYFFLPSQLPHWFENYLFWCVYLRPYDFALGSANTRYN